MDPSSKSHLYAQGVSITYDATGRGTGVVPAVRDINLEVKPGEFVCLVGPSGCGKTTFLNSVAGFLPISDGTLSLHGQAIEGTSAKRPMVFQQPRLLPWKRVIDNVSYGLELSQGVRRREARSRAAEFLDLVGLSEFAMAFPNKLSGGMQQRVNLARALAVEPEILLLDEPFASVDAQTREILQDELLRICEENAVTALFVTHDISEAVFLGDRVCVFSPRPGTIALEIEITLPKPRSTTTRESDEFRAYTHTVGSVLAQHYRGIR